MVRAESITALRGPASAVTGMSYSYQGPGPASVTSLSHPHLSTSGAVGIVPSILDVRVGLYHCQSPQLSNWAVIPLSTLGSASSAEPRSAPPTCLFSIRELLSGASSVCGLGELPAWDPDLFSPGSLGLSSFWSEVASLHPLRDRIVSWLREGVRFDEFATPFVGTYGDITFDGSGIPPSFQLPNHPSVRPGGSFHAFASKEIAAAVLNGSVVDLGPVGSAMPPRCIHPLGVEPNKPRLIYDQRAANLLTPSPPVRYDSVYDLARAIPQLDPLLTCWDHKSGYFHVKLHSDSQTFFGFVFNDRYYTYTVIPFGWSCSAFLYQTVSEAVAGFLRSLGIRDFAYVDDSCTASSGAVGAQRDVAVKACVLFLLHYFLSPKCELLPAPTVKWLGLLIGARSKTFALPSRRIDKFLVLLAGPLTSGSISFATLRRVAGKVVSFAPAVPGALLLARPLFDALSAAEQRGAAAVPLDGPLLSCLMLWTRVRAFHGRVPWRSERHYAAHITVHTDASSLGWGGTVAAAPGNPVGLASAAGDSWRTEDVHLHINTKEMLAVPLALKAALPPWFRDATVRLGTDNSSVFWLLHSGRASRNPITLSAQLELLRLEMERNIVILPFWLPSDLNPADAVSRAGYVHEEALSPVLFSRVEGLFGPFTLDAMASAFNAKCRRYLSRFPSPSAAGADFFAFPLGQERSIYCFPPDPIVGAAVAYLAEQGAAGVLIVTADFHKPWWPLLAGRPAVPLARAGSRSAIARPASHGRLVPFPLRSDLLAVPFDFRR